jgi:hypothetical protein
MTDQERDHHDERAIAFFGTWMVVGLFLDGWAHQAQKPETFFSPWHFILYSGFGAAVAYFTFRERILKKRAEGDRLTIAGLVVFIVGAVGDGIWHEIFGIEVDLEALLSPTHLALMIGGLMMLGIAYRKQLHAEPRAERADYSLVVTMTLGAAVTMFFTQYFNVFEYSGLWETSSGGEEFWEVHGIASVFVMNAIMCGLAFLIVRDWTPPRWTFTFAFGALAAGMVLLHGRRGPMLNIVAGALGGFITDLLVMRLRPSRERIRAARAFSALVPLALWSLWVASLRLQDGVHWAAELWTGTIILSVLEGVGLGLLAFPSGTRQKPPAPTDGADAVETRPFVS